MFGIVHKIPISTYANLNKTYILCLQLIAMRKTIVGFLLTGCALAFTSYTATAQTTDPIPSQRILPTPGMVVNFSELARNVVPYTGPATFVTPPPHFKPAEQVLPYASSTYTYARPLVASPSPVTNFSALPDAVAVGSGT